MKRDSHLLAWISRTKVHGQLFNKRQGVTLIELVLFIVVISIAMVSLILSFSTVLGLIAEPGQRLIASELADARMNLILLQRHVYGFNNISDPCGTSPAACAALNSFATGAGYVVSSSITNPVSNTALVTITVSGTASATDVLEFTQ